MSEVVGLGTNAASSRTVCIHSLGEGRKQSSNVGYRVPLEVVDGISTGQINSCRGTTFAGNQIERGYPRETDNRASLSNHSQGAAWICQNSPNRSHFLLGFACFVAPSPSLSPVVTLAWTSYSGCVTHCASKPLFWPVL